jgi:exodeoxyribonuclease-3
LEYSEFYLIVCYIPNSGQKLERLKYRTEEWDPAMLEMLKELVESKKKHVIWTGDLNVAHLDIDIHDPKGNVCNS